MKTFNEQLFDVIVRAKQNSDRGGISRAAASSVTPEDDQLCANMISKIIKVSDDYINQKSKMGQQSRAAASVNVGINKAQVIADFMKSNLPRY